MDNFKPNSHKYKEEQKNATPERQKLEKVVSGKAKIKQKSEIRKFTDVFISEDAANVKNYIFTDVLVPAVKKLVSDIVKDGIEMILYGGVGRGRDSGGSRASYVSYNRFSDRKDDRRSYSEPRTRSGYNYGEVIVRTRGDAEAVLDGLQGMIERYGTASVADMYDLADVPHNYTDNNYGWDSIGTAEVIRTRDGEYLDRKSVV